MEDNDIIIKREVDPNDQEDMDSFPIREEMVLVDVHIKEEDLNPLPGPNTLHQGFSGQDPIMPGNMGSVGFDHFPPAEQKIFSEGSALPDGFLGADTDKVTKQFGSRDFKSGPPGRRKSSRTAEEAECEPSTTSGKRRAVTSKSADGSGLSSKATSSKQVQDFDNDVDSNNADDLDDEDDEEDEIEDEEDPDDSNPPSMDDNSTSEGYQPKTRNIPSYKDTNSTHSDLRICHRNYTRETLRAALEAVKTHKVSMRKAAKDFGVPCSTISRLAKEENPFKRRGRGPLLTEEEEDELIRWIRDRSEMGFRVTPSILRDHVQRIMIEKPGPCLSKNGIPGRKWFTKFIARHPEISILKPEPKEPVKKVPKEKPKPEMTDNSDDRVSLGDAAMFGMSAFFEQSLLEERAFERSLNERRVITYRDPNAGSLTLSDFESAVGRDLVAQLRNEGHVESRSEEFQALHRLWRLFPVNCQNNSSMGS